MISESEFISNFIASCISENKSNNLEICEEAIKQIKECNEEIKKADMIRVKRDYLNKVLKNLNYDSILKNNKENSTPVQFNELSPDFNSTLENVISFIEKNSNITASEIVDNLSSYEDNNKIYTVIKYLGLHSIIKRNPDTAVILPGDNWEKRRCLNS